MSKIDISIVVPVYGCPEALVPLCDRVKKAMDKLEKTFEIILVNDCCPKNSWAEIEKVCKEDKRIIGINFLRNFGQIHSTNAGINQAKGDYVVLMDCDLQDNPDYIVDLYAEISKGYDAVFVKRKNRKDSPITLLFSKMYYAVYNTLVEGHYDHEFGNFCIVRRRIVNEYIAINDKNKVFVSTILWMGVKYGFIDVVGDERFSGKSSYNFRKKINLAIDSITSKSTKPLKILMYNGLIFAFLGMIGLIYILADYFISGNKLTGWTSIIASIFTVGGLILTGIGGVGIYVGNIFNLTKGVPEYVINEVLNADEE